MAFDLNEINRRVRQDPRGYIDECDDDFDRRVNETAAMITENLHLSPIVLLSGPSGSGKTTTAQKIGEALEKRGVKTHSISMDNYYRTLDARTAPRGEDGEIDLESPLCLDAELMNEHFDALSRGERIFIPKYEFSRHMRIVEPSMSIRLHENEVAVFEGIHALNDSFTARHPEAFKLYISARSNITDGDNYAFKGTWLRLVRRVVRDSRFRGTHPEGTMALWANVRRGEKKYISPFKNKAAVMMDTAFPYEVSAMRAVAEPLFQSIPADIERRADMLGVRDSFKFFEPLNPELLAPDAMLREFLGGGIYKY